MRTVWTAAVVLWLLFAVEARADTLYLRNGESIWGTDVVEQGDSVILIRPGETLRFSRQEVSRIERARISIPRFYEPPSSQAPSATRAGSPPGATLPPASPGVAPPSPQATDVPPPGITPISPPPSGGDGAEATALPPPPLPPAGR